MNELQRKKNEFGRRFFYSASVVLAINTLLCAVAEYCHEKLYVVPAAFLLVLTLLAAYVGFLLRRISYNFKAVFGTVCFILFLFFTYLSLLLCNISETVFLYYLPVVSIFLLLHSFRKTFVFVFFLVILCFFMPEISKFSGISLDENEYQSNRFALKFQEYVVIAISAFYCLFILYYGMAFVEIKNLHHKKESKNTSDIIDEILPTVHVSVASAKALTNDDAGDEKLKSIYKQIIRLFDEEKPFQCPNFNIRVLAEKVNSNTSYVSAALNKVGSKKFNQLVNEYRIEQVKISMAENVHYKFTIEHIYTNAGFSSQSTFNRIFKENVGATPREYIDSLQNMNE